MFSWFSEHLNWIFSGIGVALGAVLLKAIKSSYLPIFFIPIVIK